MKKSHELIQLEIFERRGLLLDKVMDNRLYNLRKGFEGESTVYQWFKKYAKQTIHIIDDYWFYHGKNMQVDLLVIVDNRWIVVEVKNYHGIFDYRHHECYLNGKIMSDNHFNQLVHRTQRLQHIASELNSNITVESVMVFIDEHCEINIESELPTNVIQRHQLKFYIESMTKIERRGDRGPSIQLTTEHLEKYRTDSPYQPKLLNDNQIINKIRKGIDCVNCHSFNTSIFSKHVKCNDCGHNESKKLVVPRVATELRYIYYYHPEKITTKEIYELCGGAVGSRSIRRVMTPQYTRVEKGPKTYYVIKMD